MPNLAMVSAALKVGDACSSHAGRTRERAVVGYVAFTELALRTSPARRTFKQLAGNTNHLLITMLVGLDAVRDGTAQLSEEFATSWNPRDPVRSADRSRELAIKAL